MIGVCIIVINVIINNNEDNDNNDDKSIKNEHCKPTTHFGDVS